MMRVRILPFGVLKDWLGSTASNMELPEGATVADLLDRVAGGRSEAFRGIAVSVNAEYSGVSHVLRDGDEVGLLPPVSGGSDDAFKDGDGAKEPLSVVIALRRESIDAENLVARAKAGEDGAVVVFDGIVRNHTRNRQTLYLDYEAYEELALKQMDGLARDAITKFGVRHATLVHRLGRLNVGETSVLIVVASAHRAQAFEACRWLIDTLKKTVPIWKKETFVDGAVWAAGEPFPEGMSVDLPETPHAT
jgi:molybdopterin synthase catalytic subunit